MAIGPDVANQIVSLLGNDKQKVKHIMMNIEKEMAKRGIHIWWD